MFPPGARLTTPFARTLRAMEADRLGRPLSRAAVGGALLALWLGWATLGRVSVYAQTVDARLEVDRAAHAVQSEVDGLVTMVNAELGQTVSRGDVLLSLDATDTTATLDAVAAEIRSLTVQREGLVAQLARARAAVVATGQASTAALAEARAKLAEAEAARAIALSEAELARTLQGDRVGTRVEADRAEAAATGRAAAREAAARRVDLLGWDGRLDEDERATRQADLEREIAAVDADLAAAEAERTQAGSALARRSIVAPISGVIAEQAPIRPGMVIRRGETIAFIVPPGPLKVVAHFRPGDAIGRVAVGQTATVRLDGFSWIEYGAVDATVRSVATEPRDGLIRVDLDLAAEHPRIPLQHGLPGHVHVSIERASPLRLLLRAIGSRFS